MAFIFGSLSICTLTDFNAGTMRTCYASKCPKTQKKDMIKVNEPIVGFISQSSPKNGNSSEEPEEDPEEVEEDSELEPEEDPVKEVEEEEEEDPEEEPSDYPEEESAIEYFNQSLCHNNNETEQLSEDPDEDPSEECV
ncbi:hypothetical protein LguiA_024052 [Lonicera macranthoides]